MTWLSDLWLEIADWMPAVLSISLLLIDIGTIGWILMTKSNSTSAVAWILVVLLLPFVGPLFFVLFGYQHVGRPLKRKKRHKLAYQRPPYPEGRITSSGKYISVERSMDQLSVADHLVRLADLYGAYQKTSGNHIDFYNDGGPCFEAMLEDIRKAKQHIHLEKFIYQPDSLGRLFLDELTRKAREGVEVRFLFDAMGSHNLRWRLLRPLMDAGGQVSMFLPINPFRRRIQVNMRNHRKILVIDGNVAYTGGLNIGDEYRGLNPAFGYWRDTHMRLRGPAVGDLQRVFSEDWSFASGEYLSDKGARKYFHPEEVNGPYEVQVIDSGPDRESKTIRDVYFAAVLKARYRLWIASPYFVPDEGLLDALRLAGQMGVDVRFLGQLYPDKWVPQFAARYWWARVLDSGVKVYQYAKGMMHSKVVVVDDEWASVGTANLDNRSLHLNFEVNCLICSREAVKILEEAFLQDLRDSVRIDPKVYARRPFAGRLLENACRLLSPVL